MPLSASKVTNSSFHPLSQVDKTPYPLQQGVELPKRDGRGSPGTGTVERVGRGGGGGELGDSDV